MSVLLPYFGCFVFVLGVTVHSTLANENMARDLGMSCTRCHSTDSGGPLTSPGRAFKNSEEFLQYAKDAPRVARRRLATEDNQVSGSFDILLGRHEEQFLGGSERTYRAYGDARFNLEKISGYRGLSFHSHIIARLDDARREVEAADEVRVVAAYLRWFDFESRRRFQAGRQFISVGPRPFVLDGLDTLIPLTERIDLQAYAGVPSDNGVGGISQDLAVGGRFGWAPTDNLNFGISGTYQTDRDEPTFGLGGIDARFRPSRDLQFRAHANYDFIGHQLYDSLLRTEYALSKRWDLRVDYTRLIPSSFLSKTSIFSVFSDSNIQEVTVDVAYATDYDLRWHGFVTGTFYESNEDVRTVGGGFDYFHGSSRSGVVGGDLSYSDERRNPEGVSIDSDVFTVRGFVRQDLTRRLFSSLDITADVFGGNGYNEDSLSTRFHIGFRLTPLSTLVLGLIRLDSVTYDGRLDVTLKYSQTF